jgi:hypothetical protein
VTVHPGDGRVDGDGNPILPAFTGEEALARWTGAPVPYVRMTAPDIAQMALGGGAAGVVLNPADAIGGQLNCRHLAAERCLARERPVYDDGVHRVYGDG